MTTTDSMATPSADAPARGAHAIPELRFTPVAQVAPLVAEVRAYFETGATRSYEWRRTQLAGVARMIEENEERLLDALARDIGKPRFEAMMSETNFVLVEAKDARKQLRRWMKPRRVSTPLAVQPGRSELRPEPLGVALIVAPWNYPFQLLISPLVGALAAGNAAVLKPSEASPATSALLEELVPRYLDPQAVRFVQGAVPETTELLRQRFDHIFYTGNGHVGRIVMRAAAEHLTPVTLELGGKSPCYIDPSADLEMAAKRVAFGKFFNAGQTCVAPDYLLVHASIHDAFVSKLVAATQQLFGEDPQRGADYARVVNERHLRRLEGLIESGRIELGGEVDPSDRYIAPTILSGVSPESPVMAEEIFGPILPVLKVPEVGEAIRFINARPKPLALYVFARDGAVVDRLLDETSSGGATVNHIWLHLGVPGLPFGGVGESGMGGYHGHHSFETFTHFKPVLRRPARLEVPVIYPPYTDGKSDFVKKVT